MTKELKFTFHLTPDNTVKVNGRVVGTVVPHRGMWLWRSEDGEESDLLAKTRIKAALSLAGRCVQEI